MARRAAVSSEGWTGEGAISKPTCVGRSLFCGLLDKSLPGLLAMASLWRGCLPAWLLAPLVRERAGQRASQMGASHGEAQSPGSQSWGRHLPCLAHSAGQKHMLSGGDHTRERVSTRRQDHGAPHHQPSGCRHPRLWKLECQGHTWAAPGPQRN